MSNNPRAQRTKQAIDEAFVELVKEYGYEHISVKQITVHAGIAYRTFFRHYENKEGLLYSTVGTVLQEIQKQRLMLGQPNAILHNQTLVFKTFYKHAHLLQALIKHAEPERMFKPMRAAARMVGQQLFANTKIPVNVSIAHYINLQSSHVRWWLENDMPVPPEEMAKYSHHLIFAPFPQWYQLTEQDRQELGLG